jgi:hypothetical protein
MLYSMAFFCSFNPMETAKYLLSLDPETREFVLRKMAGENVQPGGDDCGTKPTIQGSTPNGDWVCSGGQWVWVPEIG